MIPSLDLKLLNLTVYKFFFLENSHTCLNPSIDGGNVIPRRHWILLRPPQQLVQKLSESATKCRAGEVVNKRVEDAVEVGETHRCIKSQVGFLKMLTFIVPHFKDPYSNA